MAAQGPDQPTKSWLYTYSMIRQIGDGGFVSNLPSQLSEESEGRSFAIALLAIEEQ